MFRFSIVLLSVIVLAFTTLIQAKEDAENKNFIPKYANLDDRPTQTLMNINNWSLWIKHDGETGRNPVTGDWGGVYPRGMVGNVFADGITWGGIVHDPGIDPNDEKFLRVGGSTFGSGLVPGRILPSGQAQNPDHPEVRIYRIRRDYLTVSDGELAQDAAELLNIPLGNVTPQDISQVREQYTRDWDEWPVSLGAPFVDKNENGIWEPGTDEPGVPNADQVVWFVTNASDSLTMGPEFKGSLPVNIEMQATFWGYNTDGPLGQAIFRRCRLINKSDLPVDSMYFGMWSDPDVGGYTDDLIGCDSLLEMGFAYNSLSLVFV